MKLDFRLMTPDDIAFGMQLKQAARWNQTEADWSRFLAIQRDGCFVAEWDGRPVATVACFIFGQVGWVAMVLVDPPYRNRGIGRRLMQKALQWLGERGVRSIRLDATPMGRPIYETLGFQAQFILGRFGGTPAIRRGGELHGASGCRTYQNSDLEAICQLDSEVVGADRSRMLRHLLSGMPQAARVFLDGDRLVGYVAQRPGAHAVQLGPCVARTRQAGLTLLRDALQRHAGKPVFVDVPLDQPWAERLVMEAGLSCQRHFTRMTRGRQIVEQLACLWASSGPEKG